MGGHFSQEILRHNLGDLQRTNELIFMHSLLVAAVIEVSKCLVNCYRSCGQIRSYYIGRSPNVSTIEKKKESCSTYTS